MNWRRNVLEIWHLGTSSMKYGVDDLFALKIALNDPRGQKNFFLRNLVQGSSNVPRMVVLNNFLKKFNFSGHYISIEAE